MKYIKAYDVLPEHLIAEIQKYVEGHAVYIPNKTGMRKPWGEQSGAKLERIQRNNDIRTFYRNGHSMKELAERFCLSVETIKKIVYSR